MKSIEIVCYPDGHATLVSTDIHIADEKNASKIKIDFSNLDEEFSDTEKWCDVITSDDTSLRYDLGTEEIVEFYLDNSLTVQGALIITPFITIGLDTKIKFKPNQQVVIRTQADAGDSEAPGRDDYIFGLEGRIEVLEEEVESEIDGGQFDEV